MAFPVTGGTQESGYNIDNSLRFNPGDSSYLSRTLGTPTSQRIATFSAWGKFNGQRSGSNDNSFWSMGSDFGQAINIVRTAGTPQIYIDDSDQYYLNFNNGPSLRDPSAWYHLLVQIDTTQGTAANRLKFYINGTQLDNSTASTSSYPTQNYDIPGLASGQTLTVSKRASSSSHFIDGHVAEMAYIDGSIVAPTVFGETNDNGVWIPRNFKGDVTFGNNGVYLEFKQLGTAADATSIGADTSGNDNHFSQTNVTPAVDRTTDTPTNNFCTFNPLKERPGQGYATFSEGNCKATGTSLFAFSSFVLPSSGKWYAEFKATAGTSTAYVALRDEDDYTADGNTNRLFYRNDGQKDTGSGASSYGNSWTTNDIISIAANVDDSEVTFYKNGVAQNSGIAISQTCSNQYIIVATAGNWTFEANFGNAPFSISSGNSDANGYGNFEYAVPSGYYALCTKNLAQYG